MKRYTVGALALQTVVLLVLAASAYSEGVSGPRTYSAGITLTASAYFGVLFVVAFWLTGEHYSKFVKKRTLQLWAITCIALFLIPLFGLLDSIIRFYTFESLANLLVVVPFLISTILVLVFSGKTEPTISVD